MEELGEFGRWGQQGLGLVLLGLVLTDVFLTMLYARLGTGILSNRLVHGIWLLFKWASKPLKDSRGIFLSYCGPVILVMIVFFWGLMLTLGTALVLQPGLGSALQPTLGNGATDFVTALYVAGSSLAIVGASDFTPQTTPYRLFMLGTSLLGLAVTSLTLSYLLQVYTALHRRNSVGLKFHLLTAETGDAAELIAGLAPQGRFDHGYSLLAGLADDVNQVKESHHFYPVLFFFRFRESR